MRFNPTVAGGILAGVCAMMTSGTLAVEGAVSLARLFVSAAGWQAVSPKPSPIALKVLIVICNGLKKFASRHWLTKDIRVSITKIIKYTTKMIRYVQSLVILSHSALKQY